MDAGGFLFALFQLSWHLRPYGHSLLKAFFKRIFGRKYQSRGSKSTDFYFRAFMSLKFGSCYLKSRLSVEIFSSKGENEEMPLRRRREYFKYLRDLPFDDKTCQTESFKPIQKIFDFVFLSQKTLTPNTFNFP